MTRLWEAEGIGIDSESKSFPGFCPVKPEVGNLKGDLLEVLSVLFIICQCVIIYSNLISDKLKIETKKYIFAILYEIYDIVFAVHMPRERKIKLWAKKTWVEEN
tara:strand:- start:88 stop:399 length:312 start_codon:yes stop_codon:yes gene_type:complete